MNTKKGTIFIALFRIMGIIILILGIRMIGVGIYNYIDEHFQKNWISTTAYVIDISSEYSRLQNNKDTDYNITYQYEVNEKKYFDKLYNRSHPMMLGDKIKVKYDPNKPENSTDILEPSQKNLAIFLFFGTIFSTLGFFLSGTRTLIHKIRLKRKSKETSISIKEPKYLKRNTAPKKSSTTIGSRIIIILIILSGIILSIKQFPGIHPIEIEKFTEIATQAGYNTTDTTSKLSENWKIGSLLKKSVTFNDSNIHMDFLVMDTTDSASRLFKGMTLPVTSGDAIKSSGMVHELYSIENKTQYAAKVRISNTIIYTCAQAKYKTKVIHLLKQLGYWKE